MRQINKQGYHYLLFFAIGFNALITQIIFIREFLVVFSGNEISIGIILGNWLLWTAMGSFLGDRRGFKNIRLHWQLLILACLIPVIGLIIRLSKVVIHPVPGVIPGITEIYFSTILILTPVAFFSGNLFVSCSRLARKKLNMSIIPAVVHVYLWESFGAAAGGILLSLLLFKLLTVLALLLFLSILNFTLFLVFYESSSGKRKIITAGPVYLLFILFIAWLNPVINQRIWRPMTYVAEKDSPYGKLILVKSNMDKVLYENGTVLFSSEQKEVGEENVHYALLMHPKPESVLLIGGGLPDGLLEALKHPSIKHLDYVELDPAVINIFSTQFPEVWKQIENERKINIHLADGRAFLKQNKDLYDVIIIHMPDPATMQLNRFYTKEFFSELSGHLNQNGIFSFRVTGSENYINEILTNYLASLYYTLKEVFTHVGLMPGESIHYFASNGNQNVLPVSDSLIHRIKSRGIQCQYVQDYFIKFRLMPDRVESLRQQIEAAKGIAINSDFNPAAYFFTLILWGMKFFPTFNTVMLSLSEVSFWYFLFTTMALGILIISILSCRSEPDIYRKAIACAAVSVMGFSVMTLEITLLLIFQSFYGYLYNQVAILIAAVMAGLAAGGWFSLKTGINNFSSKLKFTHLTFCIIPVLLFTVLPLEMNNTLRILFFLIMMGFLGFTGGYQFPLVNYLFGHTKGNAGIIYGFDLIGALAASLLVSIVLIPLFGINHTILFVIIINCLIIFGLLISPKSLRINTDTK